MRGARAGWVLAVTTLVAMATAGVAVASSAPPTANHLVKKLVAAGVCRDRVQVNAVGTVVKCSDATVEPPLDIEVSAFPTKAAMLKSLEAERVGYCKDRHLPEISLPPVANAQYLVGPTWWTPPFGGARQAAIIKAIGGKIRTYACT